MKSNLSSFAESYNISDFDENIPFKQEEFQVLTPEKSGKGSPGVHSSGDSELFQRFSARETPDNYGQGVDNSCDATDYKDPKQF